MPTFVRDAVFQNCVFQLSAILEDFILDLLSHWFNKMQRDAAANSRIPEVTRALVVVREYEEGFRRYIGLGGEESLARQIAEDKKTFTLLQTESTIPPLDFEALLIKDKKFPSPRNLTALFRRIGMPKISQAIARRTRTDFELNLRSFMDVRNALAHENPPSITDVDVDRYFGHVEGWVNAIDREFYSHVVKVSGAAYW